MPFLVIFIVNLNLFHTVIVGMFLFKAAKN